jgi:hypothetical protein
MIPFTRDALERAAQTLWQAFLGALALAWVLAPAIGADGVVTVDSAKKFALALGGALIASIGSLIKSYLAKGIGQTGSASMVKAGTIRAVSPGMPVTITDMTAPAAVGTGIDLAAYRAAQADAGVPGIESITPPDEPGEHRAPE